MSAPRPGLVTVTSFAPVVVAAVPLSVTAIVVASTYCVASRRNPVPATVTTEDSRKCSPVIVRCTW
ncbi:MAG: hypothetical protein H0T66_11310 [Geodermatophilaceae bacterium]|nr:hypothetical protein [Geodermatophilaceae bacterium]MDQ3457083.1 hypothetical protein [Actinomycetota bacterium]